jgi:hypothetical protein
MTSTASVMKIAAQATSAYCERMIEATLPSRAPIKPRESKNSTNESPGAVVRREPICVGGRRQGRRQ